MHGASVVDGPWANERVGCWCTTFDAQVLVSGEGMMMVVSCVQRQRMSRYGGYREEYAKNKAREKGQDE